jgi:hypothetical protein
MVICYGQQYKFERKVWQQSEIQYLPFYIDSPLCFWLCTFLMGDFQGLKVIRA